LKPAAFQQRKSIMGRLLLFILLFLLLYGILYYLINDMAVRRKKLGGELEPEELVQEKGRGKAALFLQ